MIDRDFTDETLAEKLELIAEMNGGEYRAMRGAARSGYEKSFCYEENVNAFLDNIQEYI